MEKYFINVVFWSQDNYTPPRSLAPGPWPLYRYIKHCTHMCDALFQSYMALEFIFTHLTLVVRWRIFFLCPSVVVFWKMPIGSSPKFDIFVGSLLIRSTVGAVARNAFTRTLNGDKHGSKCDDLYSRGLPQNSSFFCWKTLAFYKCRWNTVESEHCRRIVRSAEDAHVVGEKQEESHVVKDDLYSRGIPQNSSFFRWKILSKFFVVYWVINFGEKRFFSISQGFLSHWASRKLNELD